MSTVTVNDAKAGLAGLVEEAMKGEIITITRHGKPAAAIVRIEAAGAVTENVRKTRPNFGEYLTSFPGGIELERNPSKMRDADFRARLSARYHCR